MTQFQMQAAAILAARPVDVYPTIADYHKGHQEILPQTRLGGISDLRVEQGGYGAGTIISFKTRVLGAEQEFHQRVSEPEPGSVLVEQAIDSPQNETTTFTVAPVDQGQRSRVTITTTMNASPGFRGVIERTVMPLLMRGIYRQELKLLEAVAQKRSLPG
ncbi:MAG: SRPBCC family protein [Ktedonobacterales bacterium]